MPERQATLRGKPVTVMERAGAVQADDVSPAATLPAQLPLMVLPRSALDAALVKKRGHAARPGSGPKGETCGSCEHRVGVFGGRRTFSKCALRRAYWTHGRHSDISKKDAACSFWLAKAAPS